MLPRTSTTSNQSRLRKERDAVAMADSIASETDLLELPTTSVFTYVWLVVIGLSLSVCERLIGLAWMPRRAPGWRRRCSSSSCHATANYAGHCRCRRLAAAGTPNLAER